MYKIVTLILIVILIGLGYVGFNYYAGKQSEKKYQEVSFNPLKSVTVGWLGPLKGPASALGVENLKAIKMALEEYEANKGKNDLNIKLVVSDDNYTEDTAVQEYEKMVAEYKPKAIFVTTYSSAIALAGKALHDSIIIINPIDNDQKLSSINHNIFNIAKETEGLVSIDAEAIIDQGKKNSVVIYNADDEFMPRISQILEEILKSNGGQVQLFPYHRGTSDYLPFLEWGQAHKADSYVFFGYQEVGYAMKQARDIGIKAPFYSVNVITDPKLQENSGDATNGTYFAHFTYLDGNLLKAENFINNFIAKYHEPPILEWAAMQAYDAANILFDSIKKAGKLPGNFTDNLRDELHKVSSYPGVSGNITILPSGASRGIYPSLYLLENGKPTPYSKIKEEKIK